MPPTVSALPAAVPTRSRRIHLSEERVIGAIALAVVVFLVGGPLLMLVSTSLNPSGEATLMPAGVAATNYLRAFSPPDTFTLIANTAFYTAGSVVIALVVGSSLAWLTERTDFRLRMLVRLIVFAWLAVPPFVSALGWIQLLNPGNGAINVLLRTLFDLPASPLNVYSLQAMIFVTGISMSPTTFIMISGVIGNMDHRLESAAQVHGAGRMVAFRRVTLPLLTPGLLAVAIFQAMVVVQMFDIPFAIGLTARVPVMSTRIYALATAADAKPEYGLAAAFGVVLLAIAILLIGLYLRITRVSERFRVVTGKGYRPVRQKLGRARIPATVLVLLYFLVMLLPLAILLWNSLLPYYQTPSVSALAKLTLQNYRHVGSEPLITRAFWNTIVLVLSTATISMGLSIVVSWISVRSKAALGRATTVLTFAPIAIPQIVFAFAILLLYLRTPLYGSLAVIIVAHITIFTAFGTRMVSSSMLQLHHELENAAKVSGASWLVTMRRVVVPLIFPQVLNGWLWIATHSARDLTVPILLMTSSNVVLASALWTIWEYPNIPEASALAVMMVVGLMVIVVPLQIWSVRYADRSGSSGKDDR
ncbi:MAG: putative iron(III)-transport system permease [Rhodospirillales bacterium]|nr:putative iron(III)-transport system permease [Rhodospirillales bacterium]